jgi:hypothetical protein
MSELAFLRQVSVLIPRSGETIIRTLTVGSIDTVAAGKRHAEATRAALERAPSTVVG